MKVLIAGMLFFSLNFVSVSFSADLTKSSGSGKGTPADSGPGGGIGDPIDPSGGGSGGGGSGGGGGGNPGDINPTGGGGSLSDTQGGGTGSGSTGSGSSGGSFYATDDYFSSLRSLPDQELVDHLSKSPQFGNCSFRKSASSSATCKYIIRLASSSGSSGSGEKYCLTNKLRAQGEYIIGFNAPSNAQCGGNPCTNQNEYFDQVRKSYENITNLETLAALIVRDKFLDDSDNCNVGSSNPPVQNRTKLSDFNTSNVSFYKDSNNQRLHCVAKDLSYKVWDYASCSYDQVDRFLPTKVCNIIYNKLQKEAELNNSVSPTVAELSTSEAQLMVKQKLIGQRPEIGVVTSPIPLEEAIDATALRAAECTTLTGGQANFGSVGFCSGPLAMGAYSNLRHTITNAPAEFDKFSVPNCTGCTSGGANQLINDVALSYADKRKMYEAVSKDIGDKYQTDVSLDILPSSSTGCVTR